MNRHRGKNVLHSLKLLADGRHIWLNWYGKPIGVPEGVFVDFEAFPNFIYAYCITPAIAQAISFNGDPCTDRILLYDVSSTPNVGNTSADLGFTRRMSQVENLLVFKSVVEAQLHRTQRELGVDPSETEILAVLRHEPALYAIAMLVHDAPVDKPRTFEGSVCELHSAILSTELAFWADGQRMLHESDAFSIEGLMDLLACTSNIDLLGDLRVDVAIVKLDIDRGWVAPHTPVIVKVLDAPEISCIA